MGAVAGSAFMISRSAVPLTNKYALLMMGGSALFGPMLADAVAKQVYTNWSTPSNELETAQGAVAGAALTYVYMYFMGM